jgi:hypothetical protein
MQIFILDRDPKKAALMHNNKHVVKMVTESCQLLCSVHHLTGDRTDIPYRLSHKHHPCAVWARESYSNYVWLLDLTRALLDEYTHRYNKKHACERVYEWCTLNLPNIKDKGLTDFAQAMPEQYRNKDAVKAYRNFYIGEKLHFCHYKNREIPNWLQKYIINNN